MPEWQRLSDEVTGSSWRARLSCSDLLRACAVSKHWCSTIRSTGSSRVSSEIRATNPWLFLYCTNLFLPSKNQAYAYDPDEHNWDTVPSMTPPSHSPSSMAEGAEGMMYATMGITQSRLCYNHSLFVKTWKQTTEMSFSREAPLVGSLEGSSGRDASTQLIGVDGVEIDMDDLLAVEIYDTVLSKWEVIDSLPKQFEGSSS